MGRILAIDYGAKRSGLAWTDPLQIIATGIGSLDTVKLEERLKKIVSEEEVECIVLGYPTKMDGSDTHATPLVRAFAEQLQEWFPEMPLAFQDERMTSQMASQSMIDSGVKKKKRKDKYLINEVSAVIILQEYMQEAEG